jgi:hypothetical protein
VIWPIESFEAPDKHFRFWFRICLDIRLFVHSAYSQYMYRSIPRILSIWTDSFHVFSLYKHSFHVFSVYKQQNFVQRFTSFSVFFVYIQILSLYSQYTYRFIPPILRMRPNNLEYSEWSYLQLLKGYWFKKSMYVCNWTKDLQGIINYFTLAWQKIYFHVFWYAEWPSNLNISANSNLY